MKLIRQQPRLVILLTLAVGGLVGCGGSDPEAVQSAASSASVPSDTTTTSTSDPVCDFAQEKVAELQGETGFDSFVLYIGRAGDSSVWETSEGYTLVVGNEIVEQYLLVYDKRPVADELVAAVEAISAEEREMRVLFPGDGTEPWDCEVREPEFPSIDLADVLRRASE